MTPHGDATAPGGGPGPDVRPIRLHDIDAALGALLAADRGAFERVCGASAGPHMEILRDVIAQTLALHARAPRERPWGGYLAVDPGSSIIVGTCGYRYGPLEDGVVEIAYFTFPEHEGQGYATAMAAALLRRALDAGAREVIAHTLPARNASTRILEKVGLRFAGEVHDPEDGRVWRWSHTGPGAGDPPARLEDPPNRGVYPERPA